MSKNLCNLMATAAKLRADGATWAAIGQAIGRSPATCRAWVKRCPSEWQRLMRSELVRHDGDVGAMALQALRELLRDENTAVQLRAAEAIINALYPKAGALNAAVREFETSELWRVRLPGR